MPFRRHDNLIRGSVLAGLTLLAGCTVGPDYATPSSALPSNWSQPHDPSATDSAAATVNEVGSLHEWWTAFNDPVLNDLIERAQYSNLDLKLAEARVREARALRGVVAADRLPNVDSNASYSRSRYSENSFGFGPGIETDLYQAGFDATWEVDLFGRVRRNIEAADSDIAAAVEDQRSVLVTLLAEVARNYVEYRGYRRQAVIAQNNLRVQGETLAITRSRRDAGIVGDLDVARADAQVLSTESHIPEFERDAQHALHAISVLLGQSPSALNAELAADQPIPSAVHSIPIGLPSDLLRRRPDIRRAERQLAGATARIGLATADLYPRFSITGSLGLESAHFSSLGTLGSGYWSIGPSVRWPVLDWGRIRSNIAVQNAREEQAFITYEQSILTGLREVEDALTSVSQNTARRHVLIGAAEANRRAVALASDLYQQGLSDFLSVLQAQRDLFESEDALVQCERDVTSALIALYKALGGGWDVESTQTATTTEENQSVSEDISARSIDLTHP